MWVGETGFAVRLRPHSLLHGSDWKGISRYEVPHWWITHFMIDIFSISVNPTPISSLPHQTCSHAVPSKWWCHYIFTTIWPAILRGFANCDNHSTNLLPAGNIYFDTQILHYWLQHIRHNQYSFRRKGEWRTQCPGRHFWYPCFTIQLFTPFVRPCQSTVPANTWNHRGKCHWLESPHNTSFRIGNTWSLCFPGKPWLLDLKLPNYVRTSNLNI